MSHRSDSAKLHLVQSLLLVCVALAGSVVFVLAQTPTPPAASPPYGQARELSKLKDAGINESSGIAASNCHPNAFWTHNDSGDSARLFLLNTEGETVAIATVQGASAIDWEDIASFKAGKECRILIADTGDNRRNRKNYVLYIIREPEVDVISDGGQTPQIPVEPILTLPFSYEDGPNDCEAVGVDPTDSRVYLVSKELKDTKVYSMSLPEDGSTKPEVARAIAALKLPLVTAMDISPDGLRAMILTYEDAFEFIRTNGETWAQAFAREPRTIRMPPRKQGESICYGVDGKTLYLTSEGESQPLWEIPIP
jgi:hypothetical protein